MDILDKEFYELKADVKSQSESISNLATRMASIEHKQEHLCEISKSLSLMAQSLKRVEDDVAEVKDSQKSLTSKVAEIENAPAQETLANIKKIKIAAITAIATMIATGVGGAIIVALSK